MTRPCVSCKQPSEVKTTSFYCSKCFLSVLERKIRANVRAILKNECEMLEITKEQCQEKNKNLSENQSEEKIDENNADNTKETHPSSKLPEKNKFIKDIELIIKIEHKQDCALAFILSHFLHAHGRSHIWIETDGKQSRLENDLENVKNQKNAQDRTTQTLKVFLTRYTKEDLASLVLDTVLEYKINEMQKFCGDGYILPHLNVVNVLKNVSDKEMSIFLFLKSEEFENFLKTNDFSDFKTHRLLEIVQSAKCSQILDDSIHRQIPSEYKLFVYQMNEKNKSTSTNITETVFKGFRDKKKCRKLLE